VSEDDDDSAKTFTVTAAVHNASKFAAIDDGAVIQIPPISRIPTGAQAPPTNVLINGHTVITQGIATNVMTISWTVAKNAARYQVEWQRDNGEWVQAGSVSGASIDIDGVYTGTYIARVTAYNAGNDASIPALSAATEVQGKTGSPPTLSSLTTTSLVFGIEIDWAIPAEDASDTQRTEIWYSQSNDLSTAIKLGDYAYPQNKAMMMGLAAGVKFYFWGRLVDKTGNIGPWYPTDTTGVVGQSSDDASAILDYISGQIDESLLGQDLLAKIGDIDLNSETIIKQSLAQYTVNNESRTSRAYIARLDETKATPEEAEAIAQQTVGAQMGDLSAQVQETT